MSIFCNIENVCFLTAIFQIEREKALLFLNFKIIIFLKNRYLLNFDLKCEF